MTEGSLRATHTPGLDPATEERLLDASERLHRRIGVAKTSMADVARAAGVSRATLYRYFDSREALLTALSQRATDRFFAASAEAMDALPGLSAQLRTFTETMVRTIHPTDDGPLSDQDSMVRMLTTQSAQALRRTARFLRPYLERARDAGEIRADLDVPDASEWLARMVLSFTIFQASIAYPAEDPVSVGRFVQRYAIDGLT